MSIDLAGWSALAGVGVTTVAIILEGQRSRFSLGVDLILKLNEQFDSDQFRERRRRAATGIKGGAFEEADEVFDFFDTVGMFTRRGVLDKRIVWSVYYSWVYYYWQASEGYISDTMEKSPTIWSDFKYLHDAVLKVDRRENKGKSFQAKPNDVEVVRFLADEENLDLARVKFSKIRPHETISNTGREGTPSPGPQADG